jgi:hypothetical protein
MRKLITGLCLLALICAIVFYSCKKEENFSVIPAITFSEFKIFGTDSATCKINFTDGDGDIGLDPFDTLPPFNLNSRYNSDLFLVYYFQDTLTKVWKPFNLKALTDTNRLHFDTLQFKYRIPNLTQNGQKKSLQGEIKVRLLPPYTIPYQGCYCRNYKYKITLVDRALHVSNEVETGPLPTPP